MKALYEFGYLEYEIGTSTTCSSVVGSEIIKATGIKDLLVITKVEPTKWIADQSGKVAFINIIGAFHNKMHSRPAIIDPSVFSDSGMFGETLDQVMSALEEWLGFKRIFYTNESGRERSVFVYCGTKEQISLHGMNTTVSKFWDKLKESFGDNIIRDDGTDCRFSDLSAVNKASSF